MRVKLSSEDQAFTRGQSSSLSGKSALQRNYLGYIILVALGYTHYNRRYGYMQNLRVSVG